MIGSLGNRDIGRKRKNCICSRLWACHASSRGCILKPQLHAGLSPKCIDFEAPCEVKGGSAVIQQCRAQWTIKSTKRNGVNPGASARPEGEFQVRLTHTFGVKICIAAKA